MPSTPDHDTPAVPSSDTVPQPSSLLERRLAAARRAGAAMTIVNQKVSDEGVEDEDRTWALNPRDPNEIVGQWPVSVSYFSDNPPGFFDDTLSVHVRFLAGSAVPETLSARLDCHADPDQSNAPLLRGMVAWPDSFLDDERRQAIQDEQRLLRSVMNSPALSASPVAPGTHESPRRRL